jgi:hypothetical protein
MTTGFPTALSCRFECLQPPSPSRPKKSIELDRTGMPAPFAARRQWWQDPATRPQVQAGIEVSAPTCKVRSCSFAVRGVAMQKLVSGFLAGTALGFAMISVAYADCRPIRHCTREGCVWRHVCPPSCPDRYSCSPLYGAYGPYGGVAYWRAYTAPVWDPR